MPSTPTAAPATAQPPWHVKVQSTIAEGQTVQETLDKTVRALLAIKEIAQGQGKGNKSGSPKWEQLFDSAVANDSDTESEVEEAATAAATKMMKHLTSPQAISECARFVTLPQHLKVVVKFNEKVRATVRDQILQAVLRCLTNAPPDGESLVERYAREQRQLANAAMMAYLVHLGLVSLRGAATTLEAMLKDNTTKRSAIFVLAKLAEIVASGESSAQFVSSVAHLKEIVLHCMGDPELEYDVLFICKWMGWKLPKIGLVYGKTLGNSSSSTSGDAEKGKVDEENKEETEETQDEGAESGDGEKKKDQEQEEEESTNAKEQREDASGEQRATTTSVSSAIVSLAYFAQKDELVSGSLDGVVALWGRHEAEPYTDGPVCSFNISPYFPACMDVGPRGTSLAIACAPTASPPPQGKKRLTPQIRIYPVADGSIAAVWNTAPIIIDRPNAAAITCIRSINSRQAAYFVGEHNAVTKKHNLVFFSANGTQVKEIADAHKDYVTALTTSTENENVVISGGRDGIAKMWDSRAPKPPGTALHGHNDAVTCISSVRDVIVTGSLDRKVLLWDTRKTSAPTAEKTLSSPVLRVVSTAQVAVVATATSLVTLQLHPLETQEILRRGKHYQELRFAPESGVVFAASTEGVIDVFALRKGGGGGSSTNSAAGGGNGSNSASNNTSMTSASGN